MAAHQPALFVLASFDALKTGAQVSLDMAAFLLVLSTIVWEAFARKEVHFYWIFAATIQPPWSYVVGVCTLLFMIPWALFMLVGIFLVYYTCHYSMYCVGQAYQSSALQLPVLLWCAMMIGYFSLWIAGKLAPSSPKSKKIPASQKRENTL